MSPELTVVLRRRSVDGRAIVVQRSALHTSLWHRVADVDLTSESLYDALARRTGRRVERATETFRAVGISARDADLLSVEVGRPCLESTRASFSGDEVFLVDQAFVLGTASEIRAERTADDLRLGYSAPS